MKKFAAVFALICVFAFTATLANAKNQGKSQAPGQAKKQGETTAVQTTQTTTTTTTAASTPPGWQHGKKTGWHGGKYPPGWSKWDKKTQTKWIDDRDRAIQEISGVSVQYGISRTKRREINQAFCEAIAGGLMINDAKNKLVGALKDENSRKNLMIDTTQSVLELLR
jgi:hypothetical protein